MKVFGPITRSLTKAAAGKGLLRDSPGRLGLRSLARVPFAIVARLVQAVHFYRTGAPRRDQLITIGVFFGGVLLATSGYFLTNYMYGKEAQQQFARPATQFTTLIGKTIDRYVEAVSSVGAFFTASNTVDRWEFFEFTRESLPRYPGVRALQWIPKVTRPERAAMESQAVEDGLFGFGFTERNSRNEFVPAQQRDEYYPLYYVEPFSGNEGTLGWDLASDPKEQEVLNLARDLGTMVATRSSFSTIRGDSQPEFAIIIPIYRTGEAPETIRARRESLAGFARGVFRIGDMLTASLPAIQAPPGLDIYVYDQDAVAGSRLLYYYPSPLRRDRPAPLTEREAHLGLRTAVTHEIAGWPWRIVIKPVSSQFNYNVDTASWAVWAIIVLLTTLLVQYMVSTQTRTQTIEHSVAERTAELSAANAALETEIHERRRIERELRAAKDEAEVANRSKSEFLAMMSHELRTPLNAVIGFAEILSQESLGPIGNQDYRAYAEDIRLSGTHLLSLINDILDLSKIEANRLELSNDKVDVQYALRSILPILQEKIATADLNLTIDLPDDLPGLEADERALRQILINLLSNAVKFTPEGGRIVVGAETLDDGCLVLRVADSGIGIAEQDMQLVRQPFNQVDSRLARKYEGTGLGLPLCDRLMELHGGRLEISSTLGCGTTISLIFPKHRVIDRPKRRPERAAPQTSPRVAPFRHTAGTDRGVNSDP